MLPICRLPVIRFLFPGVSGGLPRKLVWALSFRWPGIRPLFHARVSRDGRSPDCTSTPRKNVAPENAVTARGSLPTNRRGPQTASHDNFPRTILSRSRALSRCSVFQAPVSLPENSFRRLCLNRNSRPISEGLPPMYARRRRRSVQNKKRLVCSLFRPLSGRRPSRDSAAVVCVHREKPFASSATAQK